MRLPWVSRTMYDAIVAAKDVNIAGLRREIVRLSGDLTVANARVVSLEAAQQVVASAKRERSKLTQAIRDQSRQPDGSIDPRLVNHFRREANRLLNSGSKEKDVIEQISQWQTTERSDALSPDLMAAMAEEL